jgi:hypothetical protein
MAITTKTKGHFIINSAAISLGVGQVVSYRDDATVRKFATEAKMLAAHKAQFPDGDASLVLIDETIDAEGESNWTLVPPPEPVEEPL